MRKLLLFLSLVAFACSPVTAGKNAGGALLVHTDDGINYTFFAPPDYCAMFPYDGDDCIDLNPTSNFVDPGFLLGALVYYVAGFPAGSSPGVTVVYFGHDHNFAAGFIAGWSFCGPPNSLEIPDAGWPDDVNAGNAVGFGSPVTGDLLFPFYWFGVYGDAGNYIGPRINPTGGYAGFVSDDNPGVLDECFQFGTMGWFGEGQNPCFDDEPEACCFEDGSCMMLLSVECAAAGGIPWGPGTICEPNPCPQAGACCREDGSCDFVLEELCGEYDLFMPDIPCDPNPCHGPNEGACCFADGSCIVLLESECAAADGEFQGVHSECDPNPCTQPGACCDGPVCYVTTEEECLANGHDYVGDNVPCDPNPCATPTEEATWGRIKASYK